MSSVLEREGACYKPFLTTLLIRSRDMIQESEGIYILRDERTMTLIRKAQTTMDYFVVEDILCVMASSFVVG